MAFFWDCADIDWGLQRWPAFSDFYRFWLPSWPPKSSKNRSKIVKNRCSIKAVGGIKTYDKAIEIIEAGATYIGTSFGFEITQDQKKQE